MARIVSNQQVADQNLSPEELIRRYQRDQNSLWVYYLIQRYQHLIASHALRVVKYGIEHEDVRQELFIHLSQKLQHVHIRTNITSWLLVVIRNFLIDMALKEQKRKKAQEGFMNSSAYENYGYSNHLDAGNILTRAKNELSDMQFHCFHLFYAQDQSYNDIAESLHLSLKQVDNALRIARTKLKKVYQTG